MPEKFEKMMSKEYKGKWAEDMREVLRQEEESLDKYVRLIAREKRRTPEAIRIYREFEDATAKSMFMGREEDPDYRELLHKDRVTFNICPVDGKFSLEDGINDTFEFCSRECDNLDAESTLEEREKRKKEAFAFYENHLKPSPEEAEE